MNSFREYELLTALEDVLCYIHLSNQVDSPVVLDSPVVRKAWDVLRKDL